MDANNAMGKPENLELVKTIILNGEVCYCLTNDEKYEAIGVKAVRQVKRFNGSVEEIVVGEFPLTKRMAEECGWRNKFASVQMLTGDTPIDMDHLDETKIVSMMGEVESKYYHEYSEITGYLWTNEDFKCGGHDIKAILESHIGKYIHMEIELYDIKKKPTLIGR